MFRVGNALERAHVVKIGVGRDNAYRFRRIDDRAAADSDDNVGREFLEFAEARLHVVNSRVSLDVVVHDVTYARVVQYIRDHFRHAELHEVLVRHHERFLIAAACKFALEFLSATRAEITRFVEYHSHNFTLLFDCFSLVPRRAYPAARAELTPLLYPDFPILQTICRD